VRSANLRPLTTLMQEMLMSAEAMRETLEQAAGSYHLIDRIQVTGNSLKMAMIIVVVTPIIMIYPFVQRYFAKGIMIGSMKE